MQHLLLKAATTAVTDQGTFEAVISTATIDRERDIVDPAGFVRALHKWVPLGKKLPLLWDHARSPQSRVGHIDPATARVRGDEVVARGQVDFETPNGTAAWTGVKSGTLGFSFGYVVPEGGAKPRRGGGKHIFEVDVFEVTATWAPMQNDTRVLAWKAAAVAAADDAVADDDYDPDELLAPMIGMAQSFIDNEDDPDDVAAMREVMRALLALQGAEADEDDGKGLRRAADEVRLTHATGGRPYPRLSAGEKASPPDLPAGAEWLFPEAELTAVRAGDLKAVWSASMVNDLPDSAFLYVEPGGTKDSEGKTVPRSNRHFPYKDASGAVDLPHLRNALARIPQSNLSPAIKDRLTAKAQQILDAQKSITADTTGQETKSRSVDPQRRRADALALDYLSDGESLRKAPRRQEPPKPEPEFSLADLKQRTRQTTLIALAGVDDT